MEIKNAKINSTSLGREDHGILSGYLNLQYDSSSGQSFGGYSLHGEAMSIFVDNVLKIVGVETWEELIGKYVRVKQDDGKVYEIGNLLEDKWFNPKDSFQKNL